MDRARWAQRVHAAAVELSGDFRDHVEITEGPDGLYRELLATSPHLAGAVTGLTREHVLVREEIDDLLARLQAPDAVDETADLRELGTTLLGRLVRHRQRGADLIYEAYEVDIGESG